MKQCSATVYEERVRNWPCQRSATVQRKGKWYCGQHDPEAVRARHDARDKRYQDEAAAQSAIAATMQALADRLGCGSPDWSHGGYRESLVIKRADVEKLIERLASAR